MGDTLLLVEALWFFSLEKPHDFILTL